MQKPLKTIVVVSLLACLALATWSGIENHRSGQSAKAIAAMRIQIEHSKLDVQSKDATISDLQTKLEQMVDVLTNSTAKLAQANADAADLKWHVADLEQSKEEREARAKLLAQVPTNEVWSRSGRVLLVGAKFLKMKGRSVMFIQAFGGGIATFDVDELHPAVLARYDIDPALAKVKQVEINQEEAVWVAARRREMQALAAEQARQKTEQDRIALEQSKQDAIDAQREFEDNMRQTAAQNDSVRAQAAMRQANAAMYQALNPQPSTVVQQQQMQQQNYYRVGY